MRLTSEPIIIPFQPEGLSNESAFIPNRSGMQSTGESSFVESGLNNSFSEWVSIACEFRHWPVQNVDGQLSERGSAVEQIA